MPTFPDLDYSFDGYGYSVEPNLIHTTFSSGNTRQRKINAKRDDIFNVSLRLIGSDLVAFETFVKADIEGGGLTYDAPYFDGDVERTGTAYVVNGNYSVNYLHNDYWQVSYDMEIKDRDMTGAQNIYEFVNEYSGFEGAKSLLDALEDCVNNNNL